MPGPSTNPLVQQLQLLLGVYGYNFYSDVNKARADDLLVRETASLHLTTAAAKLAALEQGYRQSYIPPSTREQPFPPAQNMQALRQITALKQKIGDVDARLRGMPVPAQDKTWWRFRDEQTTLDALLSCDRLMIQLALTIENGSSLLSPAAWDDVSTGARSSLDIPITQLESAMQMRMSLLQAQ